MSANSDPQAAITEASAAMLSDYCDIAVTALVVYEYLVTVDSEIMFFWKPCRINGPSILFLLNRYLNLTFTILDWTPLPSSFQVAVANYIVFDVFRYSRYLPWAGFSALRFYALFPGSNRYKCVATAIVFALSVVPFVLFLPGLIHWTHYSNDPIEGVIPVSTEPKEITTAVSLGAADLFILCVTWYQTYETVKIARYHGVGHDNRSFASTLLRDGGPLLILNVLYVAFTLTSVANGPWGGVSLVLAFGEQLTSVLTSRFLINLQKVKRRLANSPRSMSRASDSLTQSGGGVGSIGGFIGPWGASISFHDDDVEENGIELS
ncbi:hypothetical protein BD309DRAFT_964588 [Dichomitus squalens]|nr:hypothetical protein BD309DRAFT_964588 [Dichomitus squalens]